MKIRQDCRGIKIGDAVGRLKIIGPFFGIPKRKSRHDSRWMGHKYYAVTQCECGTISVKRVDDLSRGDTKSCGCFSLETMRRPRKHGQAGRGTRSRAYRAWVAIRERCTRPSSDNYRWYGGRGIKVCDAWSDFGVFWQWCQESGYEESLTIDRIDPNGNYEPANCQWLTHSENVKKRWAQS